MLASGAPGGQVLEVAAVVLSPASFDRNRAIAVRSAGVSGAPCGFIAPLSSEVTMACCESWASASGSGVRFSAPGRWQTAQFFSKSAFPLGAGEFWAAASVATRNTGKRFRSIEGYYRTA